jgi:alpha-galactosidase
MKLLVPLSFALLIFGGPRLSGSAETPVDRQTTLALTPPMGWNSWDSYGLTVKEAEVKANADWLARNLRQYGWKYVVVDEGWYLQNPESKGKPSWRYTLSKDGRYTPAPNRFPSATDGAGFKPLADYVHSLGLKFGIHIIRGIPREAVMRNLPIEGSSFRAADAANQSDACYWRSDASTPPAGKTYYWNTDNYGVRASAAGQAYYDSLARLYAGWGVDFVKVDCISSPYKAEEIRMISLALKKTGRPIVLSLSPGPTPVAEADEVRKYAQMWRISGDSWDVWGQQGLAQGLKAQFGRAAQWARYAETGHWPDADMLPIGYLGPHTLGEPRQSKFTHDEQRTLLTLFAMLRSPLMIGGNLPFTDSWTTSLLANRDVIEVNQDSTSGHPVITTADTVIWLAEGKKSREHYVAVFNIGDRRQTIQYAWEDVDLRRSDYEVLDLWNHKDLGTAKSLHLTLEPHASVLYRLLGAN